MQKDTEISNSTLYLGKAASKYILRDIKKASKSIKIVTPYISSDFIDILKDKAKKGAEVSLVLNSDIGSSKTDENGYGDSFKSLRKLIDQIQHTNFPLKEKRDKAFKYIKIISVLTLSLSILGLYHKYAFGILLLMPIIYFIRRYYLNLVIYKYSYTSSIDVSIPLSPYHKGNGVLDKEQYLVHSKLYIIDDKIVYIGSVNFTYSSFYYNYESRVKITDEKDIKKILKEFNYLINNDNTNYLDISWKGKAIYKEPPN